MKKLTIIGGGLAGCEAAWQAARMGVPVELYEMKPHRFSPAHRSENLAELVCSNSLRARRVDSAVGLLKEEMRRLHALTMAAANATAIPAGQALAVDRHRFAAYISRKIEEHPKIRVIRREVVRPPDGAYPVILATGPLTSDALAAWLADITGSENLAFYDAIAPIVAADSLDSDVIYRKSRWDEQGPGDYLNCPLTREQYERFVRLLLAGDKVPLRSFEEPHYFEGCLPIEIMAARGLDTLRFGPMKPVGLAHPVSGHVPHAVVQLRAENRECSAYNMVGFQTKLTYSAQKKIFRTIPGLEHAEFLRLGSVHRNTFLCAPRLLTPFLEMRDHAGLYLAGQLSGVEGYVESAAMGLLAGRFAACQVRGCPRRPLPPETAHGALVHHLVDSDPERFQPANVNFGLFPALGKRVPKKERGHYRARQALAALEAWRSHFCK